jgi:hypothetical protein
MKVRVSGIAAASVLAFGMFTVGPVGAQQSAQPQTQPGAGTRTDQQVTITGCVQREADYRKSQDAGRGGVAGTGVGAANEFVLTDASATSSATGARAGTESSGATGTTGTAAAGAKAYELTGPNEGQASQYVGRRVEIRGKLKAGDTTAGGQPTGGATAGQPPAGVDVMSKDLQLQELEVTSVREASGTCPPMK